MERAAQLRAQGQGWPEVAEALGLTASTVKHYPSNYPPFDALVDWYRERLWSEEVAELTRKVQPAALQLLLDALKSAGAPDGATWGQAIQAALGALKRTGYEEGQKTRRKLEEQEEVTGEPGERLNVHQADQFDDMDDDELEERIDELEAIVDDDAGGSET